MVFIDRRCLWFCSFFRINVVMFVPIFFIRSTEPAFSVWRHLFSRDLTWINASLTGMKLCTSRIPAWPFRWLSVDGRARDDVNFRKFLSVKIYRTHRVSPECLRRCCSGSAPRTSSVSFTEETSVQTAIQVSSRSDMHHTPAVARGRICKLSWLPLGFLIRDCARGMT